jgi:hypothetical protein
MNKELLSLELRAKAVEESVNWWETKLSEVLDSYESAKELGDEKKVSEIELEIKSLLRRAKIEKIEMAKIESDINQACAEAAFKGEFSPDAKRRKNG